jgi:Tfp pilus assembly protein PilZ
VLGRLQGQIVSLEVPIAVREISLGGMSIETPVAFEAGEIRDFFLTLGDGAGVELAGRVVYSRPSEDASRQVFVSGIQFVDRDDTHPDQAVSGLIDRV